MKQEDLMKAMNGIDDALIENAREKENKTTIHRAWRAGLIAAAAVICLAITAVAVVPKFFKLTNNKDEAVADMEQQVSEYGDGAYIDMSSIENEKRTGEEAAEVSRDSLNMNLDRVLHNDDNEILSDEMNGATWSRRITYSTDGNPGAFYIADDLTTLLKNDARFDADFSYLEQIGTPVSGAIWMQHYFRPDTYPVENWEECVCFNATYRTPSGGAIQIGTNAYTYYIQRTMPVYSENFAFEGTVTSADGVSFTIFGLPSGRIFAETFKGHVSMLVIGFDCPREEVEDIIRHSYVAPMLDNLSTFGDE